MDVKENKQKRTSGNNMSLINCCWPCKKTLPADSYERSRTIRPTPSANHANFHEAKTVHVAHARFASTEMISINTALRYMPSPNGSTASSQKE